MPRKTPVSPYYRRILLEVLNSVTTMLRKFDVNYNSGTRFQIGEGMFLF